MIYATCLPHLTEQLDSFTFLRIGARGIHEKFYLRLAGNLGNISFLDGPPGWNPGGRQYLASGADRAFLDSRVGLLGSPQRVFLIQTMWAGSALCALVYLQGWP